MDIFEWFKGFGAIFGTLTGIIFFWEKFSKEKPVSYIIRKPLSRGSMNTSAYFRIENRSQRPIVLSWKGGTEKDSCRLSAGHERKQMITSIVKDQVEHILEGSEKIDLVMSEPTHFSEMPSNRKIQAQVEWRYLQSKFSILPCKLSACISKKNYLQLIGEEDE